jgi:polo-like kinase 1
MCRICTRNHAKQDFCILKSNFTFWHAFVQHCELVPFLRYTLLIGRPPFETNSLKETYSRIKKCEYKIPPSAQISNSAVKIIQATLQPDPKCRPKVEELLNSEFLTSGIYFICSVPCNKVNSSPKYEATNAHSAMHILYCQHYTF